MVKTSFTKAKHFYEWYVIPLNCKGKAYFCRRGNVKMKSLFWRRLYIDFHYLPLKKHGTTCSGNALLMVEVKAYEKWVTKVMSCVSVGLFANSVIIKLPALCTTSVGQDRLWQDWDLCPWSSQDSRLSTLNKFQWFSNFDPWLAIIQIICETLSIVD